MTDTLIQLDNAKTMSAKYLLILSVEIIFISDGFVDGRINKISNVMLEADLADSIQNTW